jgi:membrane associated rhomboid family serine protease
MMSFWFFANSVGMAFGPFPFMAIYVGALLVGNLLAVQLNKSNFNYRALGASGAVAGIIFSSILVNPYQTILIFFIPMPAWMFAIAYVLFSIYGIKKQNDHIGHEAHLGGAITGILLAILFQPELMIEHTWLFLALILPSTFFLFSMQLGWNWKSIKSKSVAKQKLEEFRKEDFSLESEINYLLDKISAKGYDSLSEAEKKRLDQLSKNHKK